jgi:hypothetical protein
METLCEANSSGAGHIAQQERQKNPFEDLQT